jgi:hypothetical protein
MKGYNVTNLQHMIDELGEDSVGSILHNFCCPLNLDVERFIQESAIEFSKQTLSRTYIVTTSYKGTQEVIGYFTLSYKLLHASRNRLSETWRKRMKKFGTYDADLKKYSVPAPLIAQLSKNYAKELNKMITGDELLKMAFEKIAFVHMVIGGRIVFVECQDNPNLIEFYQRNGFIAFGERPLDPDEVDLIPGEYLIQMVNYLKEPQ